MPSQQALPLSAGVHSNGFSLVRRVVERLGLPWDAPAPFDPSQSLGSGESSFTLTLTLTLNLNLNLNLSLSLISAPVSRSSSCPKATLSEAMLLSFS